MSGVKGDDLEYQLRTLAGTPGPVRRVPLAPIPLTADWPGQLDLAENADGEPVVVYAQGNEQIRAARRDRARVNRALAHGTVTARVTIRAAIGSEVKNSTFVVKLHR